MALITCPECGKEISDTAKHCVHCGYNMESYYIYIWSTYQINPAILSTAYTNVFGITLSQEQLAAMVQSRIVWTGKDLKQTQSIARKLRKIIPVGVRDKNHNELNFNMKTKGTDIIFFVAAIVVWIAGIIPSFSVASVLGIPGVVGGIIFFGSLGLILFGFNEILAVLYRIDVRDTGRL